MTAKEQFLTKQQRYQPLMLLKRLSDEEMVRDCQVVNKYERLSERMRDRYNLFGSLPDTIKDEWIEDIETLGEKMDEHINAQKEATEFDLRYTTTMAPSGKDWRDCSEVLSRRDFVELMSHGWK